MEHKPESTPHNGQELLPILEHKERIVEALKTEHSVTIIGETGSGKTTQMPLFLLEILGSDKKIAMTQPRRVAARSVARYVAEQAGSRVGGEVGYSIRFEDNTTEGTRLTFMTDGILLRKMQSDRDLKEYDVVVVDEAHERSLNIDFALGLLKQIQARRANTDAPLQIIVTSATLEKEKFEAYFNQNPSVEVPGRLHPVAMHYEEKTPYGIKQVIEAAHTKTLSVLSTTDSGDILIFMPGKMEIDQTIHELESSSIPDIEILPLYGDMSPEDQDKIFTPSTKRKVIVATNIAETSITIPGLQHVIDSGLIRQKQYNPETGIESLVTTYHAKSGSKQRAGRAGRTGPGTCHRLYSEETFMTEFADYQTPEIQRSDLAHVVLSMKQIGIHDVRSFDFIDKPDEKVFEAAIKTLTDLGALDEKQNITKIGETMARLPLEPRMARMVLEAEKHGCVENIATIASFLGGRSVFVRPKGEEDAADTTHSQFKNPESDFLTMLNIWEAYSGTQPQHRGKWAYNNFLNAKALAEIADIRGQLFRVLKSEHIQATSTKNAEDIGKSITAGLLHNLCVHENRWWYGSVLNQDTPQLSIFPGSAASGTQPPFFVCENITTNAKRNTFGRNVQAVKPEWLLEVAPHMLERRDAGSPTYDPDTDTSHKTIAYDFKQTRRNVFLKKEEVNNTEASEAFARYLVGTPIYNNQANTDIVRTVDTLYKKSRGSVSHIRLTDECIRKCTEAEIYSQATLRAKIQEGFNLDLKLEDYVDNNTIEQINRENPDTITLNGKTISVTYTDTFEAYIVLNQEDIFTLKALPSLPSRALSAKLNMYGSTHTTLETLQQEAKKLYISGRWTTWISNNQPKSISDFNTSSDTLPPLPEKQTYGTDPIDNTPLFAYPGYKLDGWVNRITLQYFNSQEEANRKTEEVVQYIKHKRIVDAPELQRMQETRELEKEFYDIEREFNFVTQDRQMSPDDQREKYRLTDLLLWAKRDIQTNPVTVRQTLRSVSVFIERVKKLEKTKPAPEALQSLANLFNQR